MQRTMVGVILAAITAILAVVWLWLPDDDTAGNAPGNERPMSLTLATWNIAHLRAETGVGPHPRADEDFARLRRHARRLNADVVAVQEVDGAEALARVFDPRVYDFHVSSRAGIQRTGFAFRRSLAVQRNPDYMPLDVGRVRYGADLTVFLGDEPLRLLAVHLKSNCFERSLSSRTAACHKLKQQVPALEAWIEARAREGVPFAVLGDFNRRFFIQAEGDDFWQDINDGDPAAAVLTSPTTGRRSRCWGGAYPDFIDHVVLGQAAAAWLVPGSFRQVVFAPEWEPHRDALSDHCPIAVTLRRSLPTTAMARTRLELPNMHAQPVKGNVNRYGQRLYHLPHCPSYEQVRIDPDQGERLFPTEAQAIAAGWTRAANCN